MYCLVFLPHWWHMTDCDNCFSKWLWLGSFQLHNHFNTVYNAFVSVSWKETVQNLTAHKSSKCWILSQHIYGFKLCATTWLLLPCYITIWCSSQILAKLTKLCPKWSVKHWRSWKCLQAWQDITSWFIT